MIDLTVVLLALTLAVMTIHRIHRRRLRAERWRRANRVKIRIYYSQLKTNKQPGRLGCPPSSRPGFSFSNIGDTIQGNESVRAFPPNRLT